MPGWWQSWPLDIQPVRPVGRQVEGRGAAGDEAVAAAYGWPADLTEEEVLARLLALNRERAAAGR